MFHGKPKRSRIVIYFVYICLKMWHLYKMFKVIKRTLCKPSIMWFAIIATNLRHLEIK